MVGKTMGRNSSPLQRPRITFVSLRRCFAAQDLCIPQSTRTLVEVEILLPEMPMWGQPPRLSCGPVSLGRGRLTSA